MGCVNSSQTSSFVPDNLLNKKKLTVSTLNYCGIMNSPFEFYCTQYQTQLKQISNIFLSLIPQYIPNFDKQKFKWEMGKIDLKIRVGRYSTMFQPQTGIENSRFLNRMEFEKKWDEVFQICCKNNGLQFKQAEKQTTRLYDFIMYHTMLRFVYKIDKVEQALGKDPQIYLKVLRPFFELSFLNEQRKVKKMVDNLSKLESDVFFFQQYSQFFYKYLIGRRQHYISVDSTKDTMIIAKESSFQKKKDAQLILGKLTEQQRNNLNWAQRTCFLCLDNYIFISAHLSSKEDKNKVQIQQVKKGLVDLKNVFPDYEIIVGGDLNSFLPPFSPLFHMYPSKATELTTIKRRTITQGQFHKAEKVVQQSKDKIISTLKIDYSNIMYISGNIPQKQSYVPTNEHPFDHFVVVARIHKRENVI